MAWMLAASAAMSLLGGAANAASQAQQYKEQKLTSKYNQAILNANNRIDNALIDMDIRRIKREGESLLGTQRALVGKSGTKFSGSNVDVFLDSMRDIELDVLSLDIQKDVNDTKTRQGSSLLQQQIDSAKKALPLKMTSSLLGGASSALRTYGDKTAEKMTEE